MLCSTLPIVLVVDAMSFVTLFILMAVPGTQQEAGRGGKGLRGVRVDCGRVVGVQKNLFPAPDL